MADLGNLGSDLRLDLQGLEVPDGLGGIARVRKAGFLRLDGMMEVRFEWRGQAHTVVVPHDASLDDVAQAIAEFLASMAPEATLADLVGLEVEA